jgi:hypothetical protein
MMVDLVDWACTMGEAGDTGYASQSLIPKSPASPLQPKNEHTGNHNFSGIICYTQNNK